jgi:hypothetical protein
MLKLLVKLIWWSLLGFAAVVLIGPALAVLGTLLPFALVGAGVWGAYRGVRVLVERRRTVRGADAPPRVVAVRRVEPEARPRLPVPRPSLPDPEELRRQASRAWRLGLEVVCGALVGCLLGAAAMWQTPAGPECVVVGLLAGAAAGFVVGGGGREPVRQSA